jgi:hypothetical protein
VDGQLPVAFDVAFPCLDSYDTPQLSNPVRTSDPFTRLMKEEERKTRKILKTIDVFTATVNLSSLAARTRKNAKHHKRAQQVTDELREELAQVLSSVILDEEGSILVGYFSYSNTKVCPDASPWTCLIVIRDLLHPKVNTTQEHPSLLRNSYVQG